MLSTQTNHPQQSLGFYLMLIGIVGAGRGSAFMLIYLGVEQAHPVTVITLRVLFAGIICFVWLLYLKKTSYFFRRQYVIPSVYLALIGLVLPFYLVAYAEQTVSSAIAGVITSTVPFFVALFSWLFFREKLNTPVWLALGFAGVLIIYFGQSLTQTGSTETLLTNHAEKVAMPLHLLMIVVSVMFYALNYIGISRLQSLDKMVLACTTMMMAGIISLMISLFVVNTPVHLSKELLLIGFILGSISTALPIIAMFIAIKHFGPVQGSFGTYLLPVVSLFLGIVLLNESINFWQFAGVICILTAVYFSAWKKIRRSSVAIR